MKIKTIVLSSATLLSCITLSAVATDNTATDNQNSTAERDIAPTGRNYQFGELKEANRILGMEVRDNQDQRLGKVKDMALDLQNGRVVEVIVTRGGMLGMDEKYVALPTSLFTYDDSRKSLKLNLDGQQFTNATEIQWSNWKEATQSGQVSSVYQQYGVRPYFGEGVNWNTNQSSMDNNNAQNTAMVANNEGAYNNQGRQNTSSNNMTAPIQGYNDMNNTRQGTVSSADNQNNQGHASYPNYVDNGKNTSMVNQTNSDMANANNNTSAVDDQNNHGHASSNYVDNANAQANATTQSGDNNTTSDMQSNHGHSSQVWANNQNGNMTDEHDSYHHHHRMMVMGELTRASKVIGSTARNDQDEKLGKIENLVIDLSSGRIAEVILASGGFMGISEELSAVPPQAFKYDPANEVLTLNTTKEALQAAPHFKASEWRNATDPNNVSQVYSTYHVTAYDNEPMSGENVRYRNENGLTAMDQGNSRDDINTTAQIRKAVLADQSMSVAAQNVQIITINGQVTLRGTVKSEEEKRNVEAAASRVAGLNKVDDQLMIGTSNTGYNNNSSTNNLNEPAR